MNANYTSTSSAIGLSGPDSLLLMEPDSYLPLKGFRKVEDSSSEQTDKVVSEPALNSTSNA